MVAIGAKVVIPIPTSEGLRDYHGTVSGFDGDWVRIVFEEPLEDGNNFKWFSITVLP